MESWQYVERLRLANQGVLEAPQASPMYAMFQFLSREPSEVSERRAEIARMRAEDEERKAKAALEEAAPMIWLAKERLKHKLAENKKEETRREIARDAEITRKRLLDVVEESAVVTGIESELRTLATALGVNVPRRSMSAEPVQRRESVPGREEPAPTRACGYRGFISPDDGPRAAAVSSFEQTLAAAGPVIGKPLWLDGRAHEGDEREEHSPDCAKHSRNRGEIKSYTLDGGAVQVVRAAHDRIPFGVP